MSSAHASVIVVHAQDAYDYSMKTKQGIESVLAQTPENERNFLKNNNGSWFIPETGTFADSRYGEHKLTGLGKNVTLMGAQLGACLQYAFLDLINHSVEKEMIVTVPANAVSSVAGDTLLEVLAPMSLADQGTELKRLFSRFPEYLKKKNIKVTIQKNGIPLDSFHMNGRHARTQVILNII